MTGLPELLDAEAPRDLGGRWDHALMAGCRQFVLLGEEEKGRVRTAINRDRSWALIGWAEAMATLGVRLGSRDVLEWALVGLSLFDQDAVDSRDAEMVYAVLIRAATRIGEDPAAVVEQAAGQTDGAGRAWLVRRMPTQSALPATHREEGEGRTFAFRRADTNWGHGAELADFLDDR